MTNEKVQHGVKGSSVLKFLACSPKEFSIAPHFYSICFGKCYPPFTYIDGQKGETLYFKLEPSILGSLHSFFLKFKNKIIILIFFNDGLIKLTHWKI
jgi:hypothetical protein